MPLLDLFWSILLIFLWVAWIWTVIVVIGDVFMDRSTSGFGKAMWVLFIIVVPWLGVLTYLIVKGNDMTERRLASAQAANMATQSYIREAAGTPSVADELTKLAALRDNGTITDEEFRSQKALLMA